MRHSLFLTLYRIALRLAPRALRERHADEQVELIHRMLQEEAPQGLLPVTAWKLSKLARATLASLAAHIDRWPVWPGRRRWLTGGAGDLRHALRSLRRAPWYAGSTVAVLGAGLALSAVVFAVVDGVLFKPLPYPGADRLFVVDARVSSHPSAKLTPVSPVELGIWAAALPNLKVTTVGAMASPFNRTQGVAQSSRTVDEHFFDVVGVRPELGSFLPEDFTWRDRVDQGPAQAAREMYWPLIISHAVWRKDFGMDPSVVGRRITRSQRGEDKSGIIIRGVLPEDFVFPLDLGGRQPDALAPEGISVAQRQAGRGRSLHVLARVDAGSPAQVVESRLQEVTRQESPLHPSTDNAPHGAVVQPPFDTLTLIPVARHLGASARPALRLIAGGAAVLLVIICLNVTGLAAARGVDRMADFATRRALGASSWRLARLVGIEVLALVTAGVILGLWLAEPLLRFTLRLLPDSLVLLKTPAIDLRVVSAMAITTVGCAALIAAFPALRASHLDSAPATGGAGGRNSRAIRKGGLILIAAQAALGFILVTAGALTMTSLAMA